MALALLVILGVWVRSYVEKPLKENLRSDLTTILDAEVAALRLWLDHQVERVALLAASPELREAAAALVSVPGGPDDAQALLNDPAQAVLRERYVAHHDAAGYSGYILFDEQGRVVASDSAALIGHTYPADEASWLQRALDGEALVSPPYKSRAMLSDTEGRERTGVPVMAVSTPVLGPDGGQIAVLAVRVRPETGLATILDIARMGETGETFLLSQEGLMLSQSRFDEELRAIGLLADDGESRSILTVEVRDPGVNMMEGHRPALRRADQPLTRMAQAVAAGESGVDVDGYRDYRGVPVVGAWTWLTDYGIGVATEVDVAQAYRPLYLLRTVFWGLYALLAMAAVAIFVFTVVVARLNREARRAALKARKMGQYALEDELGKGGMGVVYRARHELLRRPTAIKLLDVERTTPDSIARFEREVKLTSQLCHPNTITVYDYGRTPEGVFFYAMELLEGMDLERLVLQYGPLSEERTVHILKQICGSLAEAHGAGLIHRDIKPANIMLTARAGLFDFVKVLDFGVVKAMDTAKHSNLTAANSWVGTPYYMAPEAIQKPDSVDARSDLYAVGAVGFYLLTGTTVFPGGSPAEVMHKHMTQPAEPVSRRLGKPVAADLEAVVLQCLEKDPRRRPQSAVALAEALAACAITGSWEQAKAESWWREHCADLVRSPAPEKQTPLPQADMPTVMMKTEK